MAAAKRTELAKEANRLTHPSGTYGGRYELRRAPVNLAEAQALLGEFCGRMVAWGLANYSERSREWWVLDGLRRLEAAFTAEPDWAAVAGIAEEIQEADGTVHQIGLSGFSLQFESGGAFYDISGVVAFIKREAERRAAAAAAAAAADVGPSRTDARMQTLLGRLAGYQ